MRNAKKWNQSINRSRSLLEVRCHSSLIVLQVVLVPIVGKIRTELDADDFQELHGVIGGIGFDAEEVGAEVQVLAQHVHDGESE